MDCGILKAVSDAGHSRQHFLATFGERFKLEQACFDSFNPPMGTIEDPSPWYEMQLETEWTCWFFKFQAQWASYSDDKSSVFVFY